MAEDDFNAAGVRDEALVAWVQNFAPHGIITLDESLCVRSWNHWMEVHSGMAAREVLGKSLVALFPDLAERKLVAAFERALKGESGVLSTSLHRYLLSLPSPLAEEGFPLMRQTARITPLLSGATVCGVVVLIEDVTLRESQGEILRRQHRRDQILSWALAHLLKAEDPRKTVRQLFFKIAEHMDFDTFLLYLKDVETGAVSLYTSGGVPADSEEDFVDYPLLSSLTEAREIVIFDGLKARMEPEYVPLKQAGVSAAVAIPLFANERTLGMLCFATWSRETIAMEEAELLTTIGQYLATAVDRDNTRHQLQKARRELFEQTQLLEKKVEERTSRLQETIVELETFAYTLAHDLKAPVRGMIGYCDVLLEDFVDRFPAGAKLIVSRLMRTSVRMDALIKDLLAFSKVSREEVVLSPVEIEPLIHDLLALRLPTVRRAVTVCEPLHRVHASATLLQQVLTNLVDNAVKFVGARNEPRITIWTEAVSGNSPSTRSRQLVFSSTEQPGRKPDAPATEILSRHIRIWVSDEGIGIPREVHQKIFGIFERATTAEVYEGTGMGLAIVARAAQRMGGTCGVESEPGKGSRFWVELPAG